MRFARLAVVVMVGACSSSGERDRAADCAKIRGVVDEAVTDVPRRYRDEAVREARGKLEKLALGDEALKRAVIASDITYDGIERLCTRGEEDRERDCAELRVSLGVMPFYLPPDGDDIGILDEGFLKTLEQRPHHDRAVQAAVRDMVRETRAAFFAPPGGDTVDAARQRAHAAYDKLAKLCALKPR